MKKRRLIIGILIIIFGLALAWMYLIHHAFNGWTDGVIDKKEEIKVSNLGDKFILRYETRNFPDLETALSIQSFDKKKEIVYLVAEGEVYDNNLITLIDWNEIRCYAIFNALLYKTNKNEFKGISISQISINEPSEKPDLLVISKALVEKKEWKWIEACGEFLMKAEDNEIKATLLRYATGEFTKEELKVNNNSEITKEEMQEFAKKILEKYNVDN